MNIYFLRHGETNENNKNCFFGKTDGSLNENGRLQSQRAGEKLKDIKFDAVYVSTRKRTLETAKIALKDDNLQAIEDERINEMSFGVFEGKSYEDIKKLYPKESQQWEEDWKGFLPPEGESYLQFYDRVKSFMEDILKEEKKNILIVTHGGVIRTAYAYILGGNMDFFWKFASKNADISLIKYQYGNLFIDSITHV